MDVIRNILNLILDLILDGFSDTNIDLIHVCTLCIDMIHECWCTIYVHNEYALNSERDSLYDVCALHWGIKSY